MNETISVAEVLAQMRLPFDSAKAVITQFLREEDGEPYGAWKIETENAAYVLKEAKEYEAESYRTFLKILSGGVPKIYDISELDGKTWLLMEFIPGGDLRKCTRAKLTLVLDALIAMQERFWNDRSFERCGYSYEKSLAGRKKRGEYLEDLELEAAYGKFLEQYSAVPRTLCHDDLLPFNVLVSAERAVFIDWEYAGILPYPAAFARLIAHGEEGEDAFFHMRQADRAFAISYYYESLLKGKGISRADWQKTLDYFLLYEYCEWVMIGNRYGDTSGGRYRKYLALAKEMAKKLL